MKFVSILFIIFSFGLSACHKADERKFWALQDKFASTNHPQCEDWCSPKMEIDRLSSFTTNGKSYFKVKNFLYRDIQAYIAYKDSQYYYATQDGGKEYLLFDFKTANDFVSEDIPIDTVISFTINGTGKCKLSPIYGGNTATLYAVEWKYRGAYMRNPTSIAIILDGNEWIAYLQRGHTAKYMIMDFYKNDFRILEKPEFCIERFE